MFARQHHQQIAKAANMAYRRHPNDADDNPDDHSNVKKEDEDRGLEARGQVDEDDVTTCMADERFERREKSHVYGNTSQWCPPTSDSAITSWSAREALNSSAGNDGNSFNACTWMKDTVDSSATGVLRMRCVVERVNGSAELVGGGDVTEVEKDDYVILRNDVILKDLVQLALCSLGYSLEMVVGAKGAVQLKNWKPLPFDVITDNPTATIDQILGEVKVFTLRLRLPGKGEQDVHEEWRDGTVRCAVVALLKHLSQSTLAKLSPLSQSTISSIASGRYMNRLSEKKCWQFGTWYSSFVNNFDNDFVTRMSSSQLPVRRATFHPEHELPLMRNWFASFPTPTDNKFNMFARIVNSGPARHHRPKISPQKLKRWWKNERQKEKHVQRMTLVRSAAKKTAKKVSFATSAAPPLVRASDCRIHDPETRRKSTSSVIRVRSSCSDTTGMGSLCKGGASRKERRDAAVQHVGFRACSSLDDEGEAPDQACISSSTDREMPDLVPAPSSPDSPLPRHGSSSPSPPPLPYLPYPHPQPARFARSLHKQPGKSRDATFPLPGQGHVLLPGQPPSSATWQSSVTSWSSHRRSSQDKAAAASSWSSFFLPAWQNYLPLAAPYRDRSRSGSEQEVISSDRGNSLEDVERYRYPQDLSFTLPASSKDSSHTLF